MNNDINEQFHAAGEEAARRIREAREAKESPRKATAENGDKFAAHMESILAARREESGIEDLLN